VRNAKSSDSGIVRQCRRELQLSAVVCPVEHGLALSPAALAITTLAVFPDGRDMAGDRPPPPDLTPVVGSPATHVVAAIPLEPPAWILQVNPAVPAPNGERLRGVDVKVVEPRVPATSA